MEIINSLFRLIFLSFIVWTFIWVFKSNKHTAQYNADKIDRLATRIVMAAGALHIFMLIFNFFEFTSKDGIQINQGLADRAFGQYWFGLWIHPLTYFGLTQLLWINNIRTSKIIRTILAFWIFGVMHFEHLVILITSLHRDYLPG